MKRIEDFNKNNDIDIRCWDGIEIENRLNKPNCYSLIHTFFPQSSEKFGWKIIEPNKPFMWVGFYKDYCLYLCARSSFSFNLLKNVEFIIGEVEKIQLPKLKSDRGSLKLWGIERLQHLRPRAFYFDSKNSDLHVYIDYLVAKGSKHEKILNPKELMKYLDKITDKNRIWIYWDY